MAETAEELAAKEKAAKERAAKKKKEQLLYLSLIHI